LIAGTALPLSGQAASGPAASAIDTGPIAIASSAGSGTAGKAGGELVREIDDPHSGARWLLLRNLNHPGGPGRLIQLPGRVGEDRREEPAGQPFPAEDTKELAQVIPVIHAGDPLTVEEDTAAVSSRLQAVALTPAAIGSAFAARLRIGNMIVQARALGPGRAAFLGERGGLH
jgi:hypothetical protein